MSKAIQQKNERIRNQLRRKQIQDYINEKRQMMRQSEEQQEENNIDVSSILKEGNIEVIYNFFYKGEGIKRLYKLTPQDVIKLHDLLMKDIDTIQSILVLKSIIDIHYAVIFLNSTRLSINQQAVYSLYEKVDSKGRQIRQSNDQQTKDYNYKIANGILSCIRSLIFNNVELQQQSENHGFNYAESPQFIKGLIFNFDIFYESSIFLAIISFLDQDYNLFGQEDIQIYFSHNLHIVGKLIDQIDKQKCQSKSLRLLSLIIVNSYLSVAQPNKLFLDLIFLKYLKSVKIVYSSSQQNMNQEFRSINFYVALDNLQRLFDIVKQELLETHLGQYMSLANLWSFFWLLLRLQGVNIRRQIYNMITSCLKNMLVNRAKLEGYISQTMTSFIVEGLQSNHKPIVMEALSILEYILIYWRESGHSQEMKYMMYLEEYGVEVVLENLVYQKNQYIQKKAEEIVKMMGQLEHKQMIPEQ